MSVFVFSFLQVRAVQSGMVLVLDEADKAPTHVTCVLKNIIEGGDITLADGRRIVHSGRNINIVRNASAPQEVSYRNVNASQNSAWK